MLGNIVPGSSGFPHGIHLHVSRGHQPPSAFGVLPLALGSFPPLCSDKLPLISAVFPADRVGGVPVRTVEGRHRWLTPLELKATTHLTERYLRGISALLGEGAGDPYSVEPEVFEALQPGLHADQVIIGEDKGKLPVRVDAVHALAAELYHDGVLWTDRRSSRPRGPRDERVHCDAGAVGRGGPAHDGALLEHGGMGIGPLVVGAHEAEGGIDVIPRLGIRIG